MKISNIKARNTGKGSTGDRSTGDRSTGNFSTGDRSSGDFSTGEDSAGNLSTGARSTGWYSAGDASTGSYSAGDHSTGDHSTGDYSTGEFSTGDCSTGNYSAGDYSTGEHSTGDFSTGDFSTGDYSTGYYSISDRSAGFFSTITPPITFFDLPWGGTRDQAVALVPYLSLPKTNVWVDTKDMTAAEKEEHPEYKTLGGYLKVTPIPLTESFPKAWATMSQATRKKWLDLPNFDAGKFLLITGVDVRPAAVQPKQKMRVTIDGVVYELTEVKETK